MVLVLGNQSRKGRRHSSVWKRHTPVDCAFGWRCLHLKIDLHCSSRSLHDRFSICNFLERVRPMRQIPGSGDIFKRFVERRGEPDGFCPKSSHAKPPNSPYSNLDFLLALSVTTKVLRVRTCDVEEFHPSLKSKQSIASARTVT